MHTLLVVNEKVLSIGKYMIGLPWMQAKLCSALRTIIVLSKLGRGWGTKQTTHRWADEPPTAPVFESFPTIIPSLLDVAALMVSVCLQSKDSCNLK